MNIAGVRFECLLQVRADRLLHLLSTSFVGSPVLDFAPALLAILLHLLCCIGWIRLQPLLDDLEHRVPVEFAVHHGLQFQSQLAAQL